MDREARHVKNGENSDGSKWLHGREGKDKEISIKGPLTSVTGLRVRNGKFSSYLPINVS